MTTYNRGSVILVNFPYADQPVTKQRPAVIVQGDWDRNVQRNCVVIQITSRPEYNETTRFLVKRDSSAGKTMGLLTDSVIVCEMIMTISVNEIKKWIGACPPQVMTQIDQGLRRVLGLS